MEPHRTNGGMISGQNNNLEVQQCIPLQHNELKNFVVKGSAWKATSSAIQPTSFPHKEATTATKPSLKAMAREKYVEENGRGPMIAESILEPSDVYLILPSYVEPYKQESKTMQQQQSIQNML